MLFVVSKIERLFDERVKTLFLIKVGISSFLEQSEAKNLNGN